MKKLNVTSMLAAALFVASSATHAAQIQVKITNNATTNGTYLTPVWAAFHDGSFDTFDTGSAASAELERLAEDGNTAPLSAAFSGSGVDGTIFPAAPGPFGPGSSVTAVFDVAEDGSNNYFSYASMLLPTSDFFIGNSDPFAFNIASLLNGATSKISFDVSAVYDAGTEVNDFETSAGNPIFGIAPGQTGPNQGADENGVVTRVGGLAFASFLNAAGIETDRFNFDNYPSIATIELTNVSAVPVPAAAFLFAPALLGFIGLRRKAEKQA